MDKKAFVLSLIFAVSFGMLAVMVLPAQATDFSGYVKASDESYGWMYEAFPKIQSIQGGTAERWILKNRLLNVGEFAMHDAILLEKITEVFYSDETGNPQSTTDPTEIEQLVRLENSDEMWQGGYVLWVGTLPAAEEVYRWAPSRLVTWNYWVASNVDYWTTENGLWYLP